MTGFEEILGDAGKLPRKPGRRKADPPPPPPPSSAPPVGTDAWFRELAQAVYAEPQLASNDYAAESFATDAAQEHRYCPEMGWLWWNGRCWSRDLRAVRVTERCRRFAARLYEAMVVVVAEAMAANPKVPGMPRLVTDLLKASALSATVRLAQGVPATVVAFDALDQHPDLLCCGNGVVDLRTGALGPHDPDLLLTRCTRTDYHARARHDDVTAAVACVSDEVRPWLQRLFGMAATGRTTEDVLAVMVGEGGNGKSTLLRATHAAMGEYTRYAHPALLTNDGHAAIRAQFVGVRLVIIVETEEGEALRLSAIKALTGGDPVSAQFMRQDWFTFVPQFSIVVATNFPPKVNDQSDAAWRRLRFVPFARRFVDVVEREGDAVQDLKLRDRLVEGAAQREAMLAWIVRGAVAWYAEGLGSSEEVSRATVEWRATEDVIGRFIDEELQFHKDLTVSSAGLWQRARDWYAMENRPPGQQRTFTQKLQRHPQFVEHEVTKRQDSKGRMRWHGVGLMPIGSSQAHAWKEAQAK